MLKQACEHKQSYEADLKNGVCCYQPDGKTPRRCHIPWAGIGEEIAHPILRKIMMKQEDEEQNDSGMNFSISSALPSSVFRIACFSEDLHRNSFAPDSSGQVLFRQLEDPEGGPCAARKRSIRARADGKLEAAVEMLSAIRREGLFGSSRSQSHYVDEPCWQPCDTDSPDEGANAPPDLVCGDKRHWRGFFHRFAYHLFESIAPPVGKLTEEKVLNGDWILSELVRASLRA